MATVTDFSEAELWYIYEALTTQTFAGATQQEIYEIFNGTNPQGQAISLFNQNNGVSIADQLSETISGGDTTIANLLVETLSGHNFSISNILQNYLEPINDSNSYIETYTQNIDNKLTTTNNYLNIIDGNIDDIRSFTELTKNYLGTVRTPEIISATGSGTIAVQIHNVSIANVGSAVGTITVNGTTVNLPVGAVINYDAGGNNNRFAVNKFSYNGTGTTLLIQYVS